VKKLSSHAAIFPSPGPCQLAWQVKKLGPRPAESMGLTAAGAKRRQAKPTLDDGVSCDGVHEADDDGGRQLKTRLSFYIENFAVTPID
jgi:hypothetical protein